MSGFQLLEGGMDYPRNTDTVYTAEDSRFYQLEVQLIE